jgi:hypothetical protein
MPQNYDPDDYADYPPYIPLRERMLTREISVFNKARDADYAKSEARIAAYYADNTCHICRQPVTKQDPYMRVPTCLVCPEPKVGVWAIIGLAVAAVCTAILIGIGAVIVWENMI